MLILHLLLLPRHGPNRPARLFLRLGWGILLAPSRLAAIETGQLGIDLAQLTENRPLGAGSPAIFLPWLALNSLQRIDRFVKKTERLLPERGRRRAGATGRFDFCPALLKTQIALLQVGIDRLFARRSGGQKDLDLAGCLVMQGGSFGSIGGTAGQRHQRRGAPQGHLSPQAGRSGRIAFQSVEHPQRNVLHLPLLERRQQTLRCGHLCTRRRFGLNPPRQPDHTNHQPDERELPPPSRYLPSQRGLQPERSEKATGTGVDPQRIKRCSTAFMGCSDRHDRPLSVRGKSHP